MSGYTNNREGLGLGPESDYTANCTSAELLDRVRLLVDRNVPVQRPPHD